MRAKDFLWLLQMQPPHRPSMSPACRLQKSCPHLVQSSTYGSRQEVALALPLHPVIVGRPRYFAVMAILQVRQDLRLAHFPVSIPSRPQAAMTAGRTVPPHDSFLYLNPSGRSPEPSLLPAPRLSAAPGPGGPRRYPRGSGPPGPRGRGSAVPPSGG